MSLYEDAANDKNELTQPNFISKVFLKIIAFIGVASIFINLNVNYLSKPYMQTLDLDFTYIVDLTAAAIVFLLYVYMIIGKKIWISLAIAIIHAANLLMFLVDYEIKFYTIIYLDFPVKTLSLFYSLMLFSVVIFCLPFLISKIKSK